MRLRQDPITPHAVMLFVFAIGFAGCTGPTPSSLPFSYRDLPVSHDTTVAGPEGAVEFRHTAIS